MRNLTVFLGFLMLATSSVACAHVEDDAEVASSELTSSRNQDVQTLKVYDASSFSISKGSIFGALNQEECKPEGQTWEEIKQWNVATAGSLYVKLDCTDAVAKKFGYPSMRAVVVEGYRTRAFEEASYGYVAFNNGRGGFWAKTVELVVKQATIDAPTFNGVGFYLDAFSYAYYQAPPAPGANDGNGYFLTAAQVRAQANLYPAATLRSGDRVRVIKVLLPAEFPGGGTSYVPAFYFRPFAEYLEGGEKHQRWDSVASDYFVGGRTEFNREGDILAR